LELDLVQKKYLELDISSVHFPVFKL